MFHLDIFFHIKGKAEMLYIQDNYKNIRGKYPRKREIIRKIHPKAGTTENRASMAHIKVALIHSRLNKSVLPYAVRLGMRRLIFNLN
jgi:hypothetical protein